VEAGLCWTSLSHREYKAQHAAAFWESWGPQWGGGQPKDTVLRDKVQRQGKPSCFRQVVCKGLRDIPGTCLVGSEMAAAGCRGTAGLSSDLEVPGTWMDFQDRTSDKGTD
jgi:hypothetical protein